MREETDCTLYALMLLAVGKGLEETGCEELVAPLKLGQGGCLAPLELCLGLAD